MVDILDELSDKSLGHKKIKEGVKNFDDVFKPKGKKTFKELVGF